MAEENGERGPELVAGLGQKGPFLFLGLLEGEEEAVYRLHHAAELVLGEVEGNGVQALGVAPGDLLGGFLQGPGGEAGGEVDQGRAQGEKEEEGLEEGLPQGLLRQVYGGGVLGEGEKAQGGAHQSGGKTSLPDDPGNLPHFLQGLRGKAVGLLGQDQGLPILRIEVQVDTPGGEEGPRLPLAVSLRRPLGILQEGGLEVASKGSLHSLSRQVQGSHQKEEPEEAEGQGKPKPEGHGSGLGFLLASSRAHRIP